jgi:hypothetical protein
VSLVFFGQVECTTKRDSKVTDIFLVKAGEAGGGCDGFPMEQWFQDAKLLTDRALEALYLAMGLKKPEEIKVKIRKQEAQELVLVVFNINPGDDTTDVESRFFPYNCAVGLLLADKYRRHQ